MISEHEGIFENSNETGESIMRETCLLIFSLILALAASQTPAATAAEPDLADLLKRITSFEPGAREGAFQAIIAMGREGLVEMAKYLDKPGTDENAGARYAIHGLATHVCRQGAEAERAAFVRTLDSLLDSNLPAAAKKFLIEQLQLAGRDDAVPILAGFLTGGDETLAESARQALEANDTDTAVVALRDCLPRTKGRLRVGIIDSLGVRRDPASAIRLMSEAQSDDEAVRVAALGALGRIGDPRARGVIGAALASRSRPEKDAAVDALLRMGEQLLADEKKTEAGAVYGQLLAGADAGYIRCAALLGIRATGTVRDIERILPYLGDRDAAVRRAAYTCLKDLPDERVSTALRQAMKSAKPDVRGALLRVVAERKGPDADATIQAATKDPSAEVRVVAYELLGRLGDPALESDLLEAARTGSGQIRPVALRAYMDLARAKADKGGRDRALAMYNEALELGAFDSDLRRRALRGLAAIASPQSLPVVEEMIRDRSVRDDAFRAYAAIAKTFLKEGDKERAIEMFERIVGRNAPGDVKREAGKQLRALGIQFDPVRNAGFVSVWSYLGPFPGPDINKPHLPEEEVDLGKPVRIGDRDMRWKRHRVTDTDGRINLMDLMKPNQNVTGYLYAEVIVDRAQDVLIKTGSDDEMRVWLNGRRIHSFDQPRSWAVDQDTTEARLEAGTNRLLVKICNHGGGWDGSLRITDPTGRPIDFEQKEK